MRTWSKVFARWIRISAMGLLLVAVGACTTNPPHQEMSDARQAINAAIEAGADQVEPTLVRLAKRHLKNAREAMRERRFNAARNEAVLAHRKASEALESLQSQSP